MTWFGFAAGLVAAGVGVGMLRNNPKAGQLVYGRLPAIMRRDPSTQPDENGRYPIINAIGGFFMIGGTIIAIAELVQSL